MRVPCPPVETPRVRSLCKEPVCARDRCLHLPWSAPRRLISQERFHARRENAGAECETRGVQPENRSLAQGARLRCASPPIPSGRGRIQHPAREPNCSVRAVYHRARLAGRQRPDLDAGDARISPVDYCGASSSRFASSASGEAWSMHSSKRMIFITARFRSRREQ